MIRNLLVSSAILFAVSGATAAPCSNAPYTKVMPDHKGIEYGMNINQALQAVKSLYRGKARFKKEDGTISVKFLPAHQEVFDEVLFLSTNGVITSMVWSYSNGFQRRLGGPSDAFLAVLKKIKEKIDGADDNNKLDKGYSFSWNAKEGLALTAIGVDPFTILTRFDCKTLEDTEKAKVRQNTNMGF